MYTVVSVIVMYIWLHAILLIVRIALKIAFPFLSEKSLKEVILDPEFHKNILKNILLIYGILLGISLLMAIIAKII
ncbi:TPA: hypothetical protein QFN10_000246 [Enterococcus faecium]